jgi:glycosyltransferase involved in cell wall biosynthesis
VQPLVSVILPTRNRPHLVGRALRSALAQTLREIEVRVVIDGPDDGATSAVLAEVADERVQVETLAARRGHPGALNAGLAAARAPWAAFIDDDDEWMPGKLERQLRAAEASAYREPIVSCRFLMRDDRGDRLWPRRVPVPGQPICEYLFCSRSPFFGDGLLLNSTLFARTAFLRRTPFDETLPRHSDLDWALRATAEAGAGVEFVAEEDPLVVWNGDAAHARISGRPDWRFSRAWLQLRRAEVTPRAYASFLLTWVAANAVRQGERGALWGLARDALRSGRPDANALVAFVGIACLPRRTRESLSYRAARWLRPSATAAGS